VSVVKFYKGTAIHIQAINIPGVWVFQKF